MLTKLVGTKKNIIEFARENSMQVEDIDLKEIDQCTQCDIWWYKKDLVPDLDGNLIDRKCERFYGL